MLHCITIPSKTSDTKTAIIWSSIRDMSEANTIKAFLNTRGEGRPWKHWQHRGYECIPLCLNNDIVFRRLAEDLSVVSTGVKLTPQTISIEFPEKKEIHHAVVSGLEVVDNGAVCVLGDGAAQHLPQTQGWPTQAVDG